jgi:GNAT superfamily N-acetyltransferase
LKEEDVYMPDTTTIRRISVEETYPLRHRILRPNQTLADCQLPFDKAPDSYHVGYFLNDNLIGIGTILREAQDGSTDKNIWRVRGMAVSQEAQGRGIGGKILVALIRYAASQGLPGEIWCKGRVTAQNFYQRFGFVQTSEIFDLPPIGPHIIFGRPLQEEDLTAS